MEVNGFNINPQSGEAGANEISISIAAVNEGIDKTVEINAVNGDKTAKMTLIHEGMREVFEPSDGVFVLADGGTYNVLKVGGEQPDTPVETYTRLTYIECTGNQYINTGYVVQEDDVIEMQYTKPTRTSVTEYMFGSSDANGNLWAYINSNSIYSRYGSNTQTSLSSTRWKNTLTIQRGSIDIDGTKGTLTLDGMPQVPLYIFARNNKGEATGLATIKSTGCTITKTSGELVMKLRPCKRNEDGAVGMLDLVSGQFFDNLGSEEFLYAGGAIISGDYAILDYIEFNNDKIYDTGVYGNETTEIELLFRRTDISGADYLFGCSYNSRLTGYLSASGYWRYGDGYPTFNTSNELLHYAYVAPGVTFIDNSSKTFSVGSAFQTSSTIPIGGHKSSQTAIARTYQGYLYYFRIWHGSEIVSDLMPCKRISDGVEGFWDCVTQSFVEPI